jgi:lipopolysaccharide biosynthesis regulator YciM
VAFNRLVQQLEQAGTFDDFVARLQTELQSAPADDEGSTAAILGLFELHSHRYAAARTAFQLAARQRPRDPVMFWLLGSAALQAGDATAAIDACESALALKPAAVDLAGIARDLTAALRRAGRSDETAAVWTRMEAADPDNLRLCEQAAVALRDAGLAEQSLVRFERLAAELDDPSRRNQARLAAADLKRRLGQAGQALADEEALLDELDPDSWQARQVLDRIEDALLQSGQADDLLGRLRSRLERQGYQPDLVQRLVRLLRLRNRADEVLQLLEQQLAAAPQDRSLRLLLIAEHTRSGRTAAAVAEYQSLADAGLLFPADREAWGRLLLADRRDSSQSTTDRAQQAAAIWRGLLAEQPSAAELRRVAELFRGAGLTAEALPLLQQALQIDPHDAVAREQLGSCLHALGRRDEALSVWQELAAGERRSSEAFRELFSILQSHGEHRAAIQALSAACEVLPTVADLLRLASVQLEFREGTARPLAADSLPVLTRAAAAAETFADWQRVAEQQAAALQQLGQLEIALQQLRGQSAAASSAELPAPALQLSPPVLNQLHLALLERAAGSPERALREVQQALASAPGEVAVLQLAAELSAAAGLPAVAMELREQLLQHDVRGRVTQLTVLMKLAQQLGLPEKACEHARGLMQAAPDDPAMLTAAAEVLAECGRGDIAATALEAALRRQPDSAAAALTLASLLAERRQTRRAEEVCRSALEQVSDERSRSELARLLGELHQQLGSPPDLLPWLETRIAEADELQRGSWLRTLAEVHKSTGRFALARRTLERALELDGPAPAVLLELSALALQQQDPASAAAALQQISSAELDLTACRRLLDLALRSGPAGLDLLRTSPALLRLEITDHISLLDRLLQQRRFSDAAELAERLLVVADPAWEVRVRLAVACSRTSHSAAAAVHYRELLGTSLPLQTPSADAVRSRPGKPRLRVPAGADAANPEAWDITWENSTRILLDLSPSRDPDVFSEGWCETFAVARLLAVTGLLLAENQHSPAHADASPILNSSRPAWDTWVRGQLRSVVHGLPHWSLSEALQLQAEVDAEAEAALLSTAMQLFAPPGSRSLTGADGGWLGIQWRGTIERRRQRVRRPDQQQLDGLLAAFRTAAANGAAELCEQSAAAVVAACRHAEQPAAAQQLLEYLQRDAAEPAELLAALFLQRAMSEISGTTAETFESRLQMLDRVLAAAQVAQASAEQKPPQPRSAISLQQLRVRALQLPGEWALELSAGEHVAASHRLLCSWWLRQPWAWTGASEPDGLSMGDAVAAGDGSLTASAEVSFYSRCQQLLNLLLPEEERPLLMLLVKQTPRDALELAEAAAAVDKNSLRAALLRAAAANESADLPNLLAAAEQLLALRPQSPPVVFLVADCRRRAGRFAAAREILLQLPAGLPAQSRQRSFRLLELAALLQDADGVDAAAQELAGMELSSADRSQLLSQLRISGTTSLLRELQQRQMGIAAAPESPAAVLGRLQQLQQTGSTEEAVALARQILGSDAGRGQGGVRFRQPAGSAAVALREQAQELLRTTGEQQGGTGVVSPTEPNPRTSEASQASQAVQAGQSGPSISAAPSPTALAVLRGLGLSGVRGHGSDWLGADWPACGPQPVRVIERRLRAALEAVNSGNPEDGFELLLGIEEQDAVRAAAWLASQTPAGDPVSLSALRRLAVGALTPAVVQRLTARRLQRLRMATDPGPTWDGVLNWFESSGRELPNARRVAFPELIAATARRGRVDAAQLREQAVELQALAPEEVMLYRVLLMLIGE